MATIRRELMIDRPADEVWRVVGDPGTIHRWFPGIVASTYSPSDSPATPATRKVELASGLSLVEEVVTNDPLLRRFQYRITGGAFKQHLATVDVIEIDEKRCLAIYGTDATPAVMALVLGGASGEALENLRDLVISNSPDTNSTDTNATDANSTDADSPVRYASDTDVDGPSTESEEN
ncbi:MAG: SRPBCC family protein [Microthrixaceae bacterium]